MDDAGNPIQTATDDQIRLAIEQLRDKPQFSTVDVIHAILGSYHRDVGMPPGASPNAHFGKRLMKRAPEFGIVCVLPDQSVDDKEGGTTTAAIWRHAL